MIPTERLTISRSNCQLKMQVVDIKHRCEIKVRDQNYQLYHDLLFLPNFATLEKLNYVHAFPLPTLSRRSSFPPRSAFKNSSFSSPFGDLTFLIMTNKINLSSATYSATHYGIPDSFMIYAWQSYIVRVNSA